MTPSLRLVFWETTKACNLTCRHCRAVPQRTLGPTELTTSQALDLIDAIAHVAKPVMVLSGGEPLFRPDLFENAMYGVATGFRMALATNGTLVNELTAAKIADAGISRVAISLDGADADTHERFRGLPGSHRLALRGIRNLQVEGVSVQINSTIAKHNVSTGSRRAHDYEDIPSVDDSSGSSRVRRSYMRKGLIAFTVALLWATAAMAQTSGYSKATETTVSGTVRYVLSAASQDGTVGVHLEVTTPEGPVRVALAPAMFIANNNYYFFVDEKVVVVGAKSGKSGEIWARTVSKDGKNFLILRDEDGTPRWPRATEEDPDGCGVSHAPIR